jgi:hypothetical protein
MSDLRERVPAQSLIEQLLHQWDIGAIHRGQNDDDIVIDDEAVSWYQGVLGERRIAALLEELGPDWTVLHSVPFGAGSTDIDHVVVGPGGVFTINTKYSPGKDVWSAGVGMYVGGHKQRYVGRSLEESRAASARLSAAVGRPIPVFGVLVFVDPGVVSRKAVAGVDGEVIYVLEDDELLATLRSGAMFTQPQVAQIAGAAVRPDTWHRSPKLTQPGDYLAREFNALQLAVGPAITRASQRADFAGTRPVVPTRSRPASARPTTRPGSRPASSRPARRNGRKKQSTLEKLLTGLAVPVILFVGAYLYLMNLGH